MVTIKDTFRLFGITIIICCAAFVCTMFINYRLDLAEIKDTVTGEQALKVYDAQISTSNVVCAACGGCLIFTSVVMLLTYIKSFINTRSGELGVMKALGHSEMSIARHFGIFGLSVFAGAVIGVGGAALYLPRFYELQNRKALFEIVRRSHVGAWVLLILLPTAVFSALAAAFAYRRLKRPVMSLLRDEPDSKVRKSGDEASLPFLRELKRNTVRGKRSLVFFIWFSAFCFSTNTQMAFSMKDLAGGTMGRLILIIGLVLAYTMLILALSSVVKGSGKTVAMMKVFGYDDSQAAKAVLGGYRPVAAAGFILGTFYQFGLLKIMVNAVFKDIEGAMEYSFDFKAMCIVLLMFAVSYELIIFFFSDRIKKLPVKSVMLDN